MADETGLAVPDVAAIQRTEIYQALLTDCRGIREKTERSLVMGFWELGRRISQDLPPDRSDRYGKGIMKALQEDLSIDITTLWRAVQVYHAYDHAAILDEVVENLSWAKFRMLLALDAPLRRQIEARIRSGELRTDEQVRDAIHDLKRDLGLLPPEPLPRYQLSLELDVDPRRPLLATWRKADPIKRAALLAELIDHAELERADRPTAIAAIQQVRRRLDAVEQALNEGAES